MGNQQTGGIKVCSIGQMHTRRSEMQGSKLDLDDRVGYDLCPKERFQVQRIQKTQQQIAPHQQGQEDIVDVEHLVPKTASNQQNKAYQEAVDSVVKEETLEHLKDEFRVFQGLFGKTHINEDGLVLYTDMSGRQHCEEYDRDEIGKIFPMGISHGELTKTIWFKDVVSRDECFGLMTTLPPPSYKSVMVDPTKFAMPETTVDDLEIYEGIRGTKVVINSGNIVLYADINDISRCERYCKNEIKKCFPYGIWDGGLTKSIWFKNESERDLCFKRMQSGVEVCVKQDESDFVQEELSVQKFTGLYGGIVLHPDSQIEFTSLSGLPLKCFYEPSGIRETFPKGISYGRLPKTIWFRDVQERGRCIEAMRRM